MSLANRLRIRPSGVVSKKFIGERRMFVNMDPCRRWAAFMDEIVSENDPHIVAIAVIKNNEYFYYLQCNRKCLFISVYMWKHIFSKWQASA